MPDRPILFSGPMVQALIRGDKTETRRLCKGPVPEPPAMDAIHPTNTAIHPAPYLDSYCGDPMTPANPRGMSNAWCWWTRDDRQGFPTFRVPHVPGDALWVRETHQINACGSHPNWTADMVWYQADGAQIWLPKPVEYEGRCTFGLSWCPSTHMPRWASRITLTVKAVRVERLQEIDEEGAKAEGIYWSDGFEGWTSGAGPDESCDFHMSRPVAAYEKLWDRIHGTGAWDLNPWVTVTQFSVRLGNIDG